MRVLALLGRIGLWALQLLIALAFMLIGVAKFADPSWVRKFAQWGYPDGFYMVIGAVEAAGAVALLVPRLTTYAALVLGVVMIGASATHWIHGEMARVTPPLMFLAVLIVVAAGRWRSAARILPLRRAAPSVESV
jgi:uncharacterized membrane protein YphA (DoxX/SURF4 family)